MEENKPVLAATTKSQNMLMTILKNGILKKKLIKANACCCFFTLHEEYLKDYQHYNSLFVLFFKKTKYWKGKLKQIIEKPCQKQKTKKNGWCGFAIQTNLRFPAIMNFSNS